MILSLISKNGTLTRKQLADKTRLTEDGVKWNLDRLRKTGIIRRVGPKKGEHWEFTGKNDLQSRHRDKDRNE
ncbi:MAG: winged helix-turn-helix domain-containing protein [Prevotella sp.]|nr:winged helix-turn-helix domain-containing protein [Prevotella sp.]